MLTLFVVVLIAAVVLGVLGALLHGLFYLLIIGVVVFVLNAAFHGLRISRRRKRRRLTHGRRSLR